jgi:hypothetical protein
MPKALVVGIHPANEESLSVIALPDGSFAVTFLFGDRHDADAVIEAMREQNTSSAVHFERVRATVGDSSDPSRAE